MEVDWYGGAIIESSTVPELELNTNLDMQENSIQISKSSSDHDILGHIALFLMTDSVHY